MKKPSLGHLDFAAGSSRSDPSSMSTGLGLDGVLAFIRAAHGR